MTDFINPWKCPEQLLNAVKEELKPNIQISEFDLLKALGPLTETEDDSNLDLFKRHFLLYHTLYKLQIEMFEQNQGHLDVNVLGLKWYPFTSDPSSQLAEPVDEKLRNYYLDITNLNSETEESIESLLDDFWLKYVSSSQVPWALEELSLEAGADISCIKKAYKILSLQHHPDRGGSTEKLQNINKAYEILLKAQ